MFRCLKPILQLGKCTVKAILKLVSPDAIVNDTNHITCKLTVWIEIFYVQLRKLNTKTENCR